MERKLPEGWVALQTPEGLVYYHHRETNKTQWTFPSSSKSKSSSQRVKKAFGKFLSKRNPNGSLGKIVGKVESLGIGRVTMSENTRGGGDWTKPQVIHHQGRYESGWKSNAEEPRMSETGAAEANEKGMKLMGENRPAEALPFFRAAFNCGSAVAEHNLGLALYLSGKVVEGRELIESAASKGIEVAKAEQNNLRGLDRLNKNPAGAVPYFRAALEHGSVAAEYNLGIALIASGDYITGSNHVRNAAKNGVPQAVEALKSMSQRKPSSSQSAQGEQGFQYGQSQQTPHQDPWADYIAKMNAETNKSIENMLEYTRQQNQKTAKLMEQMTQNVYGGYGFGSLGTNPLGAYIGNLTQNNQQESPFAQYFNQQPPQFCPYPQESFGKQFVGGIVSAVTSSFFGAASQAFFGGVFGA